MKTSRKAVAMILSLAMAGSLVSMSAMATSTIPTYGNNIEIQFGDPTRTSTWPENKMTLEANEDATNTYTATYGETGYYPSVFSLYAHKDLPGKVTLTSTSDTVRFATYDENATENLKTSISYQTNSNYNNETEQMEKSEVFTVKLSGSGSITVTASDSEDVTINFLAPHSTPAAGGTTPSKVNGYLPIGQFARPNDFGWGKIFTDNTNVPGADKTAKFTNGYTASGVSLGMLGGYVQFEFASEIVNNANNPYGIDFIVYGNAFNGNPEAGCVMVYGRNEANSEYGWYNLAGSRYYMDGSQKNVNISYIKLDAANATLNSAFTAPGIYCSKNYVPTDSTVAAEVNAAISAATWTGIPGMNGTAPAPVGWWPDFGEPENYGLVAKMGTDPNVGGVTWNKSGSAEVISFEGLAKVVDSDNTDDYQWGYADVRANGSNYGTLSANPYATAASVGAGGDGFDLSWAVDAEGNPVNLTDVKFVRVYSGVLHNAGVFGETSTEVCGIYVADGIGGGTATKNLTVKKGKIPVSGLNNMGTKNINVTAGESHQYTVLSNADNVYVNGVQINSGTQYSLDINLDVGESKAVQIITQTGTESPFVTLIRFTGVSG